MKLRPISREHLVERLGLNGGPRKAVEDEARFGVGLLEPVADQLDHEVVGDEVAAVVDLLHAPAELGPGGHLGAKDLAARDVRDPVLGRDALRLRALAGPLRAEEQKVSLSGIAARYLRKPS